MVVPLFADESVSFAPKNEITGLQGYILSSLLDINHQTILPSGCNSLLS